MSGSATRDWLLDKLIKLRQAMTEMKFDYEGQLGLMRLQIGEQLKEANLKVEQAFAERDAQARYYSAEREVNEELRERIAQMAPGKQFRFFYRCVDGSSIKLHATSISHANGVTTVNVERSL